MENVAKVQLRLDRSDRDWFAAYAKEANRSMNGQMIELIREKRKEVQEHKYEHQ